MMSVATKDISRLLVLRAIVDYRARHCNPPRPYTLLMQWTGGCEKVCIAAMEREYRRGFVDAGIGVYVGFLTQEGVAELARLEVKNEPNISTPASPNR